MREIGHGKLGVKVLVLGGSLDDMTNFAAISASREDCLFVKVKVFLGRLKYSGCGIEISVK